MGYVKKQLSIRKSEICDANSSVLLRVVIIGWFFLIIFLNADKAATAQAQIPVDVGTVDTVFYDENSMGYWFTAPSCFIISGFHIPSAGLTLSQTLEVLLFDSIPPNYEAFTNNFESLGYIQVLGDSSLIDANVAISAGDIVGILGSHGTGEFSSFYHAGDYNTTIAGSSVTLKKISFPGNVAQDEAFEVSADSTDTAHFQVVELYYDTGITASFSYTITSDSVAFVNTSPLGDEFLWDFGDGNSSNQITPVHVYGMNGNYTISLTISNGCFSDVTTSSILIDGIDDQEWRKPKVSIYPNVTIGPFSVELYTRESEHISVGIYGLDGQTVSEEAFRKPAGLEKRVFDLSGQAKGVYFFKVTHDHGVIVRKVVRL
jgi:PKD repeat protein